MATTIPAKWTKLTSHKNLQRSSHNVSVLGSTVYIFGGELRPREPRDNDLHKVEVPASLTSGDVSITSLNPANSTSAPSPRVGSSMTALDNTIYLFSGRGGPSMSPIDEHGSLWTLDATAYKWHLLPPSSASASPAPEARSFHAMTSNGKDTLYVHAGCPASGRLSDLWEFNIGSKAWKQLASAPEPARGGTSIAFSDGKLYRFGGFDGNTEQGGSVDIYDPETNSWSSKTFSPDGKSGPGARSVAAFLPVTLPSKGKVLVSLLGESDPSSLGHQGAGKMLSDVWAYEVETGKWAQLSFSEGPQGRGWFDADVIQLDEKDAIVVSGGLGEDNERLDDLWVLQF